RSSSGRSGASAGASWTAGSTSRCWATIPASATCAQATSGAESALREPARPDAPAGWKIPGAKSHEGREAEPAALVPPGTATIGNILDCDVGETQGTVTTFPGFSTPEPAAESRHGGSLINP